MNKRIIAIFLAITIIFTMFSCNRSNKKEYITKSEWTQLLVDAGLKSENDNDGDKNLITGKYAVTSITECFDSEMIKRAFDVEEISEKAISSSVAKNKIVKKRKLKKNVSKNDAKTLINLMLDFIFTSLDDNQVCNVKYKDDVTVYDIDDIDSATYDNGTLVTSSSESLKKGDIIEVYDEYGFATFKRIDEVNKKDEKVNYKLSNVESYESIIEDISYSGYCDFSYLLNMGEDSNLESSNLSLGNGITSPQSLAITPSNIGKKSKEHSPIYTTDLEIYIGYTLKEKQDEFDLNTFNTEDSGLKAYVSYSSGNAEAKYSFSLNSKDKKPLKLISKKEYDKATEDFWMTNVDKEKIDSIYDNLENPSATRTTDIGLKVSLKDFQILLDGQILKKNFSVLASADFETELIASTKITGKAHLLSIPLVGNKNIIGLNVDIYLEISASGQVVLSYSIDGAKAGVSISKKDGLTLPHSSEGESTDFRMSGEMSLGIPIEAGIFINAEKIFCLSIEPEAVVKAETVSGKGKYKDYPPCLQLSAYLPLLNATLETSNCKWIKDVLTKIGGSASIEIPLIKEEKAPFKGFKHIEYGDKVTILKGKTEDVCTHQDEEESTSSNNNEKKKDTTDWEAKYANVISEYKTFLTNPDQNNYEALLFEREAYSDSDFASKTGYVIKDINGDSIPELLICRNSKIQNDGWDGLIYALYTYKDSAPYLVVTSEIRMRYYLHEDNKLIYYGNWSVAGESNELLTLNTDGTFNTVDTYYTDDTDLDNVIYHHNENVITKDNYNKGLDNLYSKKVIPEVQKFN